MTRKDYVLIAAALKTARANGPRTETADEQWCYDCDTVAEALAHDNPRFDRSRFLAACRVQS